jgi:hypothetical protein
LSDHHLLHLCLIRARHQVVLGGGDELDLERLRVDLAMRVAILAPVPLGEFIKDDVARDMDAPSAWIVSSVGFRSCLVPNKNHPGAPIIQFLEVWLRVLDMNNTPEDAQMTEPRLLSMPSFERCHSFNCSRRRPVQQIHHRGYGFTPEVSRQAFCLHHTSCCRYDRLVSPLQHAILLQRVRRCELPPHPSSRRSTQ